MSIDPYKTPKALALLAAGAAAKGD